MRLHNEHGFTLVELITVLAIIGILAAVAIPNFLSWLPNMRLKAVARDLYSNMQKARMQAVKTNKDTAIIFDTANNKYDFCDDWASGACNGTQSTLVDFNNLKSGVGYGHGAITGNNSVTDEAFPGDDVSYSSPSTHIYVAVFNSQGLGNAGYVYLDNANNTTIYAVGSLASGVIKLVKWQGSSWK